ncbi:MAG: alpha/beta hydrolase [Pseudomonadota bacterium]|nr:MAG: alpha/beta hydrolase [Pseudomonadota bacterium]
MRDTRVRISVIVSLLLLLAPAVFGAKPLGIDLERYEYPYPVKHLELDIQRQRLRMAYMDVRPAKPNGSVVLLLHGKNFCGAYWGRLASDLTARGHRVVIPDQIGFCKSSKPAHFHYTFQQLAANTRVLLDVLQVSKVTVLGHSMGGMLATRFVLMYPDLVNQLVLVNPIGLEDWKLKVPYQTVDAWYKRELSKTGEKLRAYQLKNYYDGKWRPEYDPWVDLLAGMIASPGYERLAWNQALTYDMIFTQPVCYEFDQIRTRALLIIGQRDRTALGKQFVSNTVRATMGDYPALGRKTAAAIPRATLVELDDVGHLPHIEAYDQFIGPLLRFLAEAGR